MHLSQSTSHGLNDFAQLPPCKYHFRVSVSINRSNQNLDIINYNKEFLAFVYPVKCHKFCASQKEYYVSVHGKKMEIHYMLFSSREKKV